MDYVYDVRFVLSTGILVTCLILLRAPARQHGTRWLTWSFIVSLIVSLCFYMASTLTRFDAISEETYHRIMDPASIVLDVLGIAGKIMLLAYVASLGRLIQESGQPMGSSLARRPSRTMIGACICGGFFLLALILRLTATRALARTFAEPPGNSSGSELGAFASSLDVASVEARIEVGLNILTLSAAVLCLLFLARLAWARMRSREASW